MQQKPCFVLHMNIMPRIRQGHNLGNWKGLITKENVHSLNNLTSHPVQRELVHHNNLLGKVDCTTIQAWMKAVDKFACQYQAPDFSCRLVSRNCLNAQFGIFSLSSSSACFLDLIKPRLRSSNASKVGKWCSVDSPVGQYHQPPILLTGWVLAGVSHRPFLPNCGHT